MVHVPHMYQPEHAYMHSNTFQCMRSDSFAKTLPYGWRYFVALHWRWCIGIAIGESAMLFACCQQACALPHWHWLALALVGIIWHWHWLALALVNIGIGWHWLALALVGISIGWHWLALALVNIGIGWFGIGWHWLALTLVNIGIGWHWHWLALALVGIIWHWYWLYILEVVLSLVFLAHTTAAVKLTIGTQL